MQFFNFFITFISFQMDTKKTLEGALAFLKKKSLTHTETHIGGFWWASTPTSTSLVKFLFTAVLLSELGTSVGPFHLISTVNPAFSTPSHTRSPPSNILSTSLTSYGGNIDGFKKRGTQRGLNFKVVLNQGWVKNEGPAGVKGDDM